MTWLWLACAAGYTLIATFIGAMRYPAAYARSLPGAQKEWHAPTNIHACARMRALTRIGLPLLFPPLALYMLVAAAGLRFTLRAEEQQARIEIMEKELGIT